MSGLLDIDRLVPIYARVQVLLELLGQGRLLVPERAMAVVLDGVVGAAEESGRYFTPCVL